MHIIVRPHQFSFDLAAVWQVLLFDALRGPYRLNEPYRPIQRFQLFSLHMDSVSVFLAFCGWKVNFRGSFVTDLYAVLFEGVLFGIRGGKIVCDFLCDYGECVNSRAIDTFIWILWNWFVAFEELVVAMEWGTVESILDFLCQFGR